MQRMVMDYTILAFSRLMCVVWALMICAGLIAGCSDKSSSSASATVSTAEKASMDATILEPGGTGRLATYSKSARGVQNPSSSVDWPAMRRFWDASMSLRGIDTGPPDSSKHMLVFFDPDCHVCARQWQILRPYLDTIQIHWIPVAYIDRDSLKRAAAILSAEDPVRALYRNEEHYDFELKSGGYPLPSHVPDRAISAVLANTHSPAFTERAAVTPLLGLELYKGERYVRYPGMIGARYIPIIIKELGNTKHPYARTKELLRQRSGTEK